MKTAFMISTLIVGMAILYGCASSVEEKQPIGVSKIVPVSGTEKVEDEVSALEDSGPSPDEIEKLNKIRKAIEENRPLIESQLQEVFNMPVELSAGDQIAVSKEELKEALEGIEEEIEGHTKEEDKNVPAAP